jgi:large subunit ribosomal protein L28
MAKKCAVTGKSSQVAGRYSNRVRATEFQSGGKRRQYANLQTKTVFVPETGKKIKLTLSTKAIKTINKNGAYSTLKKAGIIK